jgi:hypothetical protein
MCEKPEWLPDLILLGESGGNWTRYVEVLHRCFLADFVHSKPTWPGKRVNLKRHPEHEGKSATFWHLISDGKVEADRLPDFRRCERIGWPRPIIDTFCNRKPEEDDLTIWWREMGGSDCRYVLSLLDFSYVVVVADRGTYVLPWTAYFAKWPHERVKLQRKYEHYWRHPW